MTLRGPDVDLVAGEVDPIPGVKLVPGARVTGMTGILTLVSPGA